jgi:sugar O-acyltransferase (sialic acid O-acetyltransferase NeuD family)
MIKIAMFGGGGHAKVITELIQLSGAYEISRQYATPEEEQEFADRAARFDAAVIAVGDNWLRQQIVTRIRTIAPTMPFVRLIHPSAVIATDVTIGEGTIIMAGVVVNPGTVIGEHCIINTRSSLDHDCTLASFVSVAPGSTLAGCVRIGAYSAIGIGSSIIHNIHIGEHSVIGAGATVVRSVESFCVAYGTPAKQIRSRSVGERYL